MTLHLGLPTPGGTRRALGQDNYLWVAFRQIFESTRVNPRAAAFPVLNGGGYQTGRGLRLSSLGCIKPDFRHTLQAMLKGYLSIPGLEALRATGADLFALLLLRR